MTCRGFIPCRAQLPGPAGAGKYMIAGSHIKKLGVHITLRAPCAMQNASASCND